MVVPHIADQPYWAERVESLGIGAAHDGATPTEHSLAEVLGTALSPDTVNRARTVARSIRADGATVAAKMLAELAR